RPLQPARRLPVPASGRAGAERVRADAGASVRPGRQGQVRPCGRHDRRQERVSMTTARDLLARSALVAAALAGPAVAKADTGSAPAGHAYVVPAAGGETAERQRMYAAVRRYVEAHSEIPAFARKYGMKCSACHLAVPVLNQFGQAFKDNGYRMKNGTDDLRANEPAYWPLFGWLWKDYEVDVQRVARQTVQERG